MGDFRKVVFAFVAVALFVSLASAQTFTCTTATSVPPTIRTEGVTEQVGDIVLQCTGGTFSTAMQLVNITVFTSATVTSRLLGPTTATASNATAATEAILMIDEPAPGTQSLCANNVAGGATSPVGCGATVSTAGVISPNVYQGVRTGEQAITFFGVPAIPPATSTGYRIYRITNIRVNGSAAGGTTTVPATVTAQVSISGSSSIALSNPSQVVAYSQPGLTTALRNATNTDAYSSTITAYKQCTTTNDSGTIRAPFVWLRYTENFASAFKTRTANPNQATTGMNTPGQINNNSESGFVWMSGGNLVSGAYIAGLADTATRLRALFNNVPSGVRLYVSTVNSNGNTALANPGTSVFGLGSYAQLVATTLAGEAVTDISTIPIVSASASDTINTTVPAVELPVISNQAVAVWEVINSIPLSIESFDFAVAVRYQGSPTTNSPAPGIGTVNQSYSPISSYSTSQLGTTAPIPRFTDTSSAKNLFQVTACRTVLLYPYVLNQVGFDTGLAISNTSADPFGTTLQSGTCTLNAYGTNAPTTAIVTPSVAAGSVYSTLASTSLPGFLGYVIATCNFQYAHGFAFISDLGARNLAMGYLALVLIDPTTGSRSAVGVPTNSVSGQEVAGF